MVRRIERGSEKVVRTREIKYTKTNIATAINTPKYRTDLFMDLMSGIASGRKLFPIAKIPMIFDEVETIVREAGEVLDGLPEGLSGKHLARLFTDELLKSKLRALARLRTGGQ
jgi:hypothetical protein